VAIVKPMLQYRPEDRKTANELLQDTWFDDLKKRMNEAVDAEGDENREASVNEMADTAMD